MDAYRRTRPVERQTRSRGLGFPSRTTPQVLQGRAAGSTAKVVVCPDVEQLPSRGVETLAEGLLHLLEVHGADASTSGRP